MVQGFQFHLYLRLGQQDRKVQMAQGHQMALLNLLHQYFHHFQDHQLVLQVHWGPSLQSHQYLQSSLLHLRDRMVQLDLDSQLNHLVQVTQ